MRNAYPKEAFVKSLEDVLTAWHGDAAALRRNGDSRTADQLVRCARQIEQACSIFLEWLPEDRAAERAGHSPGWMRARFHALRVDGLAQIRASDGRRLYRLAAVPRSKE
jgi:hypothetical protein